jgi:hypothetical protein
MLADSVQSSQIQSSPRKLWCISTTPIKKKMQQLVVNPLKAAAAAAFTSVFLTGSLYYTPDRVYKLHNGW